MCIRDSVCCVRVEFKNTQGLNDKLHIILMYGRPNIIEDELFFYKKRVTTFDLLEQNYENYIYNLINIYNIDDIEQTREVSFRKYHYSVNIY